MEKVILKWKEGERTWVKDHWEYKDGVFAIREVP